MLNPKALLFSGIRAGILNNATDGPTTARGGIRLFRCAEALQKYKKLEQQQFNKSTSSNKNKEKNVLYLTFNLPEFVDRESALYYSYCFEPRDDNPLQYAIAYFEFDVKSAKMKEEEEDKSTKMNSMIFSSQNRHGPNNNSNGGRRSNSLSGASQGGGNHSSQTNSSSYSSSHSNTYKKKSHSNGADEEMENDMDTSNDDENMKEIRLYFCIGTI